MLPVTEQVGFLFRNYASNEEYGDEIDPDMKKKNTPSHTTFSPHYVYNNYHAAVDKYIQLYNLQRLPDIIFAIAYHRRFV